MNYVMNFNFEHEKKIPRLCPFFNFNRIMTRVGTIFEAFGLIQRVDKSLASIKVYPMTIIQPIKCSLSPDCYMYKKKTHWKITIKKWILVHMDLDIYFWQKMFYIRETIKCVRISRCPKFIHFTMIGWDH
jgi:hypothetical protein